MKLIPLIASGALTLAAVAAFAAPKADSDGNGAVSKAEALKMAEQHFVKMDANGDGKISPEDHDAKIREHFAEMDADKNGAINETEFVAAHKARMEKRDGKREGMMGRHGGGHGGRGMKMMHMADSNGDKTITRDEFKSAFDTHFAKADADKDGSISAEERKAMHGAMRGRGKHGEHGMMGHNN